MMGKFTVEIETGNAEMQTGAHVARALRTIADELETGETWDYVRDVNGNSVGSYSLEEDRPDPAERHLEELKAIGYEGDDLEPLRAWEVNAHKAAEDYCNVEGFDWEAAVERVEQEVGALFGGELPDGFFVNGDPRGYALKLQSGTGALSQRDWGDFEILAPDFS